MIVLLILWDILGDSWSYLFGFKPVFCSVFLAFSQCQTQKIILHKVKLNPSEVRLNIKKLKKLWKLIFWTFMLFWVFWVEKVYARWDSTHARGDLMSHQSDYSLLHILHGCLRIFTSATHSILFHYRFSVLVPPMPSPPPPPTPAAACAAKHE